MEAKFHIEEQYAAALQDIAYAVGSYHGHTSREIVESDQIVEAVREVVRERDALKAENTRLNEWRDMGERAAQELQWHKVSKAGHDAYQAYLRLRERDKTLPKAG